MVINSQDQPVPIPIDNYVRQTIMIWGEGGGYHNKKLMKLYTSLLVKLDHILSPSVIVTAPLPKLLSLIPSH